MEWYEILIGVLVSVASLIIVVVVLFQQSRTAGLSGAIGGGAETFFGKNKGRSLDAKLLKWTKIIAVFFFIFTLVSTFFLAFMTTMHS